MAGTLRRFSVPVDGTIPVPALLYNEEQILASQEGVGIYDGEQKSPRHQSGSVHVSTHRAFYIDNEHPGRYSFAIDLAQVTRTEYYSGLFKSSSKATLHLSRTPSAASVGPSESAFPTWECQVCAYRNPPGLSPAASQVCGLCGVPRTSVPAPVSPLSSTSSTPYSALSASSSRTLSTSLPASASPLTSIPSSSSANVIDSQDPSSPSSSSNEIACPACTFLNHPSMRVCEICGTDLPRRTTPLMKSAPSSRPVSPDPDEDDDYGGQDGDRFIRISFRKGGDKALYAALKRSLQQKAWILPGHKQRAAAEGTATPSSLPNRSGISGILQTVESSAQTREATMTDALKDLEAFMAKAKDMVKLAADLNERLTASSSSTTAGASGTPLALGATAAVEPEEATFIRSSLSQLGLEMANTPVTQDMIRDERRWVEELARELAGVLQGSVSKGGGGMMKERGIIALDEVWCGWNRARGVALIPPSTLLQVLPLLPSYTSPTISHRTLGVGDSSSSSSSFPFSSSWTSGSGSSTYSGITVLHTPPYSHIAFSARLSSFLALNGPKTTVEIAQEEGITIALCGEMVGEVESDGGIVRDEGSARIKGGGGGGGTSAEVWWWKNAFEGYVWDGQEK